MKKSLLHILILHSFLFTNLAEAFFGEIPSSINFGIGEIDVFKEKHRSLICSVDYRPGILLIPRLIPPHFTMNPLIGAFATTSLSSYFFCGVELSPIRFEHFYTSILFSPGLYIQGNGKDLGYPLEFRSGIEVGSRFQQNKKIALQLTHISNASLGRINPGIETLMLIGDFGF